METNGNRLLERYEQRKQYINDWMARDEAKDAQLESAKLTEEPYCHHCNKQASYKEVRFAEPKISREFVVGISCLDGDSRRDDYTSRQTFEKAIDKALEKTNWRLMTSGIEYRLRYRYEPTKKKKI